MPRFFALTALAMIAFAANSLLNRAALADGSAGAAAFGALRLLSGAVCLALLCTLSQRKLPLWSPRRAIGATTLALYIFGFSFAYIALDAGLGALILFGTVQLTMFAGGLLDGERPGSARWAGTALALAGLAWLAWPGLGAQISAGSFALMALGGLGWGLYSLAGRRARDPLAETAANFLCAAPIGLAIWALWPDGLSPIGALLAIASGALTSGLGYALWYSLLPRLSASAAALSQLTVPAIAALGGAALLSEPITPRLLLASALILGGVALGTLGQRTKISKGS